MTGVTSPALCLSARASHPAALAFMQQSRGSVRTATELAAELTTLGTRPGGAGAHG